jgi:hypothetical protein
MECYTCKYLSNLNANKVQHKFKKIITLAKKYKEVKII